MKVSIEFGKKGNLVTRLKIGEVYGEIRYLYELKKIETFLDMEMVELSKRLDNCRKLLDDTKKMQALCDAHYSYSKRSIVDNLEENNRIYE